MFAASEFIVKISCPKESPTHTKGPQSPQKVEVTLAFLAGRVGVRPVQFVIQLHTQEFVDIQHLNVQSLDIH